jgi:hypothetical protein
MEVQIELQTKAQKVPIPLKSRQGEYVDSFGPDETFDGLVHYGNLTKQISFYFKLNLFVFKIR